MFQELFAMVKKKKREKGTVRGEIGGTSFSDLVKAPAQAMMVESMAPGTLDKKVKPGFVPTGLSSSLFSLDKGNLNKGQILRRTALDRAAPKLQSAIGSQDIFAYNAALSSLRTMISRTKGGPAVPLEMPDAFETRRRARIRQHRQPVGSRMQTMGIF